MLEEFEKIGKAALEEMKKVTDPEVLERFRIKYLGRKGKITQMLSQIGRFPAEQRPQAGQLANKIKSRVSSEFEGLKSSILEVQQGKTRERPRFPSG